jgi:hypothetical protein
MNQKVICQLFYLKENNFIRKNTQLHCVQTYSTNFVQFSIKKFQYSLLWVIKITNFIFSMVLVNNI